MTTIVKIKTVLACAMVLSVGGLVPTGQASAAPVIKGFSSTGGNPTNKTGLKDRMYLVKSGDKITFTVKADGANKYQWQVNKKVQAKATGNTLTWTVPDKKSIWEIHLTAVGGKDKAPRQGSGQAHQEWVVSTLSKKEAPDIFDYFTDGKCTEKDRRETDPWGRKLPVWKGKADASRKFVAGRTSDEVVTSSDAAYGTWKIRWCWPPNGKLGSSPSESYMIFDPVQGVGRWSEGSGGHDYVRGAPHWTFLGGPDQPLGGDCASGITFPAKLWCDITIIRTKDNHIYTYVNGAPMHRVYISGRSTNDKLIFSGGRWAQGTTALPWIDCIEGYKDRYLFPNPGISYGEYVDNWVWKTGKEKNPIPLKRKGILVMRGPNGETARLSDIAKAIGDASLFEYDSARKEAICHTDLAILDFSALKLEGETLKMDCKSPGERRIAVLWGATLDVENSRITTTNSNYFLWRLASTTHFGGPGTLLLKRKSGIMFFPDGPNYTGFHTVKIKNSTIDNSAHLFFDAPFSLTVTDSKFTRLHEADIGDYSVGNPSDNFTTVGNQKVRKEFVRGKKSFWVCLKNFGFHGPNMKNVSFEGADSPLNLTFILNDEQRKFHIYNLDAGKENVVVRKSVQMLCNWHRQDKEYPATLGIVNGRFKSIIVPTDKAWGIPKYYLDVKVVDKAGRPVRGAKVTVMNEIDNANYPAENMVGRYISYKTKDNTWQSMVTVNPFIPYTPLPVTTTTTSGHTPLPSDPAKTVVLADFVQNKDGKKEFKYTITVEKDGKKKVVTGVNPGPGWYRPKANKPAYTITAVLDGATATEAELKKKGLAGLPGK